MKPNKYNKQVTLKCNKCGNLIVFFPYRIMISPSCTVCNNKDTGDPLKDWEEDKYGNFTVTDISYVTFSSKL